MGEMTGGNQDRAAPQLACQFIHCNEPTYPNAAMTPNNIESIDIKLQQLKPRRAQLLAQHDAAERKRITRQAVIIGKWIMSKRPELVSEIAGMLVRDQDRAVFKLPPTAGTGQVASGATHIDILLPPDDDAAAPALV